MCISCQSGLLHLLLLLTKVTIKFKFETEGKVEKFTEWKNPCNFSFYILRNGFSPSGIWSLALGIWSLTLVFFSGSTMLWAQVKDSGLHPKRLAF